MSDLHFFFLLCNFFSSCICNLLNNVKNEKGSWEGDSRLGLALPGHGVPSWAVAFSLILGWFWAWGL
jgi:hypothetical protein